MKLRKNDSGKFQPLNENKTKIDYGSKKKVKMVLVGNVKGVDYRVEITWMNPFIHVDLFGNPDGHMTPLTFNSNRGGGSIHQVLSNAYHDMKIKPPRNADSSSGLDLNNQIDTLISKYKFKEEK